MKENKPISPPRFAEWLVKLFCRKDYAEEVLGDVHETYCWRVEENGKFLANLSYILDAFSAIRFLQIQNKTTVKLNFLTMISLKVTLRTFWRNKFHTMVNLIGLACGMMVFIAIFQYITFEKNYESFIPEAESIYRIDNSLFKDGDLLWKRAESVAALGEAGKGQISSIVEYAKLYDIGARNNCVISISEVVKQNFKEQQIIYATEEFPRMFALKMIEGMGSLDEPFQVIISSSLAKKYFSGASALGKQITFDDDDSNHEVLIVSGVFEDYPGNSHLRLGVVISFKTLLARANENEAYGVGRYANDWTSRHDYLTYVQLVPGVDKTVVINGLEALANEPIKQHEAYKYSFELTPIANLHTDEGMRGDMKAVVDPVKLDILLAVGIFVLLLAWVNFINLTTATALGRAKETGVRKILGGTRNQLAWQFIFESAFTGFIAFILSLLLYHLLSPLINQFLPVSNKWFILESQERVILILGVLGTSSVLAGIYPALVLSGFRPITVLKGNFKTSKNGVRIRKGLIVFQATISIFLITGMLAVVKQVDFMINSDLGMTPERVLVIPAPGSLQSFSQERSDVEDVFRSAVIQKPFVTNFAAANVVPGTFIRWRTDLSVLRNGEEIAAQGIYTEYDYLETLGIPIVAGRSFMNSRVDTASIILNESAVRALGYKSNEEVLNTSIYADEGKRLVIGIMKDYHHESLKEGISPMVLKTRDREFDHFFLRLQGGQLGDNLDELESVFAEVFPGNPFEYFFLDDHFNKNYVQERQFGTSFAFFATIAILIAGIGLFSLSSFITMSRKKEIAIRKVLGAKARVIVGQLNKDFVILIVLAAVIATPLSVWAIEGWLATFPYRTSLNVLFFVLPGLVVLVISLVSVSFKTIAASRVNPINLLHRE